MTSLEKAERIVETGSCASFSCNTGEINACPLINRLVGCGIADPEMKFIEVCRAYIEEHKVQPKWHDERILEEANNEIASLKADNAEFQALFGMQHKRVAEAEQLWRDAHPELKRFTSPDLGTLAGWLVSERARLRGALTSAKEAMDERRGYCEQWERKYGGLWDIEDAQITAALEATKDKT